MAGAFAEIIQVAALYPIDTIKVRCQASGLPMGVVVRQLMASPATTLAQLYAGVVSASVASVAVGSLYFFTFFELFKHRAQVGQIQGSMLGAMFKALKQQGPRALYGSFFLPFCFKSLPFDIGELLTYASLNDWKDRQLAAAPPAAAAAAAAAKPAAAAVVVEPPQQQQLAFGSITATSSDMGSITLTTSSSSNSSSSSSSQSKLQQVIANTPDHVWDMAAGAAAGAAAVLVSMPPDCVKTVLETGGGVAPKPGSGVFGSVAAFGATGRQLVAQRGVAGGLFCGMGPRLLESVPSTMLYWMAVEGARRVLEPYTAK
ncbi:hypothetical protein OEZ85_009368 [Tetradesmus obliquus]|uniref:Mitochondrial carrier domain-containing protein n=1 Tax=Tetradesmus obliquus TaxID=3088 RepID=A0ABY8UDY5_TETOB|nr:hypothetical protein OEZ85_009368 [Tetradesmus obliquus]